MRNWHEWFVTPDDENPTSQTEEEIRVIAGSGHRGEDKPLHVRKKMPPRCAHCKKFIGFDTGLHLMITGEWRIHVACFTRVLEKHWADGEVIDLSNGTIKKIDYDDS